MSVASGLTQAMPNTISFKAYLRQKGHDIPKEVRRFGLEQSEAANYGRLRTKLQSVFPTLAGRNFSIHWKDFEQDEIIISTNDELLTALTEMNDNVRRLYITLKDAITIQSGFEIKPVDALIDLTIPIETIDAGMTSAEESDNGPSNPHRISFGDCPVMDGPLKFHYRVICDGCANNIASHRYKCVECSDFDLCFDCEAKGIHSDHVMVRIPLSQGLTYRHPQFAKGLHALQEALRKIDHRRKKKERHSARMAGDCHEADFFQFLGDHHRGGHGHKRSKRDDQDKRERKAQKLHCAFSFKPGTSAATSSACGASSAAAAASTEASSGANANPPSSTEQGTQCPFQFPPGFLGSILPNLQQFLEQITPVPYQEQLFQEVARNLARVNLNDSSEPAPASATSAATAAAPAAQATATAESGESAAPQGEAPVTTEASGSSDSPVFVSPTQSQSHSPRSSSEERERDRDAEGWTVVEPPAQENANNNSGGTAAVYPVLPTTEQTPVPNMEAPAPPAPAPAPAAPVASGQPMIRHSDPRIRDCLVHLATMGYNVDDQYIVELAEEKKGDLLRILDSLYP